MKDEVRHYPITSASFWQSYLTTMRPYLLFVSGAAGLVGLVFVEGAMPAALLLAFIPLFLAYGFGQAITDCFQTDTDSISSPYRPLVEGTISRKQVLTVSLAGAATGLITMAFLNPKIIGLWILAVFGILTYTPLKRTWWGGPAWNSWIVALLPIMARLVDRRFLLKNMVDFTNPYDMAFLLSVITIFFSYANFVVMGYFKDISADRKTGYYTAPVVFGWRRAAIMSDITAALAIGCAGFTVLLINNFNIYSFLIWSLAATITLYAQFRLHRIEDENEAHGPVGNIVRVFILICLAIIVALQPGWLLGALLYYLIFELVLRMRPERSQV